MVNNIKEDKTQSGEHKVKETKLKVYLKKPHMRSVNAEICMQEYYKPNKKDLHLLLLFKQLDEYNYVQKKPKTVSDI